MTDINLSKYRTPASSCDCKIRVSTCHRNFQWTFQMHLSTCGKSCGSRLRVVQIESSLDGQRLLLTSTSSQTPASLTCTTCSGATFLDVNEQRSHFRSDWHRYNVKNRLHNPSAKAVTEAEFGDLVEGQSIDPSRPNLDVLCVFPDNFKGKS